MSSSNKSLVVKGKAGLGNRMLCACTGMLYARLSRRKLVIDWTDGGYAERGVNPFSKLFTCPDIDGDNSVPHSDSVRPEIWKGKLDASAGEMVRDNDPTKFSSPIIHRKYSIDLRRLDYPEEVAVMWAFTHQLRRIRRHFGVHMPHLAQLNDQQVLQKMLRDELKAQPAVLARVQDFANKHFRTPMIGVHVRLTDKVEPMEKYLRHTERFINGNPNAKIFLATDNRTVIDQFEKTFGTVIQTEKWFPPPGVIMHQNPECPDLLQNAIDALIDMHLLSRCDFLIHARSSTFSQIAFLLSNINPAHEVDVEKHRLVYRSVRAVKAWLA